MSGAGTTVLVTGGVRSGKSRHAEALLRDHASVTYVATGPVVDDPDWRARVAGHRARRPAHWSTVESTDLAEVLDSCPEAVLVECLGTWVTALVDQEDAWERGAEELRELVDGRTEAVARVLARRRAPTVLVTNEVGWGLLPAYRSGRVFADLLGTVNQRLAVVCGEVHLVVAGRVLRL